MLLDVINSEIQKFNECGLAEWSGILDEAIAKFDLGNQEVDFVASGLFRPA